MAEISDRECEACRENEKTVTRLSWWLKPERIHDLVTQEQL